MWIPGRPIFVELYPNKTFDSKELHFSAQEKSTCSVLSGGFSANKYYPTLALHYIMCFSQMGGGSTKNAHLLWRNSGRKIHSIQTGDEFMKKIHLASSLQGIFGCCHGGVKKKQLCLNPVPSALVRKIYWTTSTCQFCFFCGFILYRYTIGCLAGSDRLTIVIVIVNWLISPIFTGCIQATYFRGYIESMY